MPRGDRSGGRRSAPADELRFGAELLGLCGLVVTQPVLAVFGEAPEELTARQASPLAIVAFAVAVAVVPAAALWLLEQPFRLFGAPTRARVHRGVLGGLVGLLALEVVKELAAPPAWSLLVVAVAAGSTFFVLSGRWSQLRLTARYLALAPVAFVALFLFASPVAPLVTGGGADALEVEVAAPAPVVMVMLDELPTASLLDGDGELDEARWPGFAALAEDATWYRNHTTVAPVTPSALPAALTGLLPTERSPAPVAERFPDNLFTLLGASHELRVDESFTRLCPVELCGAGPVPAALTTVRGLLAEGGPVLGSVASPWAERADLSFEVPTEPTDAGALDRFEAFVARAGEPTGSGRPPLDYLHVLLPHQPFDLTPDGRRYDAPDPPRGVEYGTWFDDGTAAVGQQRHLWQVALTDRLIADLVDRLEATGVYDESLVVVTSDHGVAFTGDEPIRGISEVNAHETLWTPLFVKPPGQGGGGIDDGRVETIDLVPTIAEVLGIELPFEVDGVSRLDGGGPADLPARVLDWRFSTVEAGDDGFATIPAGPGFESLLGTAPPGAGADDPYAGQRIGPHGDLVGLPVTALEVGAPTDLGLRADLPARGFDVEVGSDEAPAYFSGHFEGDPVGWTALALDGEVVAVARTYEAGLGRSDLAATIPPDRLTPGDHELEVFVIEEAADRRRLRSAGTF